MLYGAKNRPPTVGPNVWDWIDPLGLKCEVNIDTGTASAFVSQNSPVRHQLKEQVAGKQMVMTESAANEFKGVIRSGGPIEKARAQRFMDRVKVIPDNPSSRAMALTKTKKVGEVDKVIFGTGDKLGIKTMTGDAKFVRGAKAQGVEFDTFVHSPVPLTGT